MNNQYLNEEKYKKTVKIMKRIAFISLGIGILFFVLAIFLPKPGMMEQGWYEGENRQAICLGIGFFCTIMIPGPLLFWAHGREIAAYQMQSMMPIAKEGMKEMAPTVGETAGTIMKEMAPVYKEVAKEMAPAYGEVAKEVGKGIAEGMKEGKGGDNNE